MFPHLSPTTIAAAIVLVVAWVALMVAAVYFVARAIARNAGGGWGRLMARYPAPDGPPAGCRLARGRTAQAGLVVARRCATIGVGPQGLFLEVPWRHAALIPWTEIVEITPTTLNWREAVTLAIGEPLAARVTVFGEDFEAMRPYLRGGSVRPVPDDAAAPAPASWEEATPAG